MPAFWPFRPGACAGPGDRFDGVAQVVRQRVGGADGARASLDLNDEVAAGVRTNFFVTWLRLVRTRMMVDAAEGLYSR